MIRDDAEHFRRLAEWMEWLPRYILGKKFSCFHLLPYSFPQCSSPFLGRDCLIIEEAPDMAEIISPLE